MEVDVAPFFTHGVSLPNPRLLASANLIALLDDPDIYDESVVWPEHSHVRRAHGIELRRGCDGLVRPRPIEEVFVEGQTHDDVAVRLGLDARQRWVDHLRVRSIVARGDRAKEASRRCDDFVFGSRHGNSAPSSSTPRRVERPKAPGPSVRHAEWCCPVVPNVTPAPYTSDDTPRVAATFVHSPPAVPHGLTFRAAPSDRLGRV